MVPALKSGKIPYYLDHGYKENGVMHYGALDMIGAWTNGEIEGSLLYGTAFLEPGNPLGAALADKLRAGLPVGHSVGFLPLRTRAKMDGGQIFDEVSLWEVSAVGIPSNPDAVSAALKSIRAKAGLRKAPADPAGRVVLTQSADGTVTAIPEAAFREATRAGIEKGLAPLNRQLEDLAGVKAAVTRAPLRGVVRKASTVTPGGLIR
ncbi:MAG: hypothetical protein KO254_04410 [Methanoculleus marisnigri]|nr:hypothetical protein [Methanoculleus marisnigri]